MHKSEGIDLEKPQQHHKRETDRIAVPFFDIRHETARKNEQQSEPDHDRVMHKTAETSYVPESLIFKKVRIYYRRETAEKSEIDYKMEHRLEFFTDQHRDREYETRKAAEGIREKIQPGIRIGSALYLRICHGEPVDQYPDEK